MMVSAIPVESRVPLRFVMLSLHGNWITPYDCVPLAWKLTPGSADLSACSKGSGLDGLQKRVTSGGSRIPHFIPWLALQLFEEGMEP